MKKILVLFLFCFLFICCSNNNDSRSQRSSEDLSKLSKLQTIDVPKGFAGMYVGELPCKENEVCNINMVLDSTKNVLFKESLKNNGFVEYKGEYKDSVGYIIIRFNDNKRFFTLKKNAGTSLIYVNVDGMPYLDDSEEPYQLFRILNMPSTKD